MFRYTLKGWEGSFRWRGSGVASILRSRLAGTADTPALTQWVTRGLPVSRALAAALPDVLAQLLSHGQIKALVIEELSPALECWTFRGVGISGFVVPALIDAQLAEPKPFFVADLLGDAATGTAIFLKPPDIARANANGGLDLVVEYLQGGWDLSDPLWRAVVTIAHETYVKHHRGYRLRRALQKFWSAHSDVYLPAGYRALKSFELSAAQLSSISTGFDTKRTLCYADGAGTPGQTVGNAFQYVEPRCGFTPAEQRVLLRAVDGLTDAEIAHALQSSPNSVKQAWRTIYERARVHAPFVFVSALALIGLRPPVPSFDQ